MLPNIKAQVIIFHHGAFLYTFVFCAYTYTSTHTHTLTHTLFGSEIVAVGIKRCLSSPARTGSILSLWRHAQRHHAIAPSSATLSLHPSLQLSLVTVSFSQSASSSSCTSRSLAHTHTHTLLSSLLLLPIIETFAHTMLPPCRKVTEQRLPPATVQAPLERARKSRRARPSLLSQSLPLP